MTVLPSLWLSPLAPHGEGLLVATFFSFQIPFRQVSQPSAFSILPGCGNIFLAALAVQESICRFPVSFP